MGPGGGGEPVIAGIALEAGIFASTNGEVTLVQQLFSAVVIMAVITTVLSPIILRHSFKRDS